MIKSYNLLKLGGGVSEDFLCAYIYIWMGLYMLL